MALGRCGGLAVVEATSDYPAPEELGRLIRLHSPDLIFLSLKEAARGLETGREIVAIEPSLPLVGFGRRGNERVLLDLIKLGVREMLSPPFQDAELADLAHRIRQLLNHLPPRLVKTGLLTSFLPAKPGVGTSTIALNTSIALSKRANMKVLLADFDLTSGLIAFMLKMGPAFSLLDMVNRSQDFDEDIWYKLIARRGNLDVLASGRAAPGLRVESIQIDDFLAVTRRLYDFLCVDLSGGMEPYSNELLCQSERIFLVCTPEVPALHLARERYAMLDALGLTSRVNVILNRWDDRQTISRSEVETMLNVPIFETLPNDYKAVHSALMAGREVNSGSKLALQISGLADKLLNPGAVSDPEPATFFRTVGRRLFGDPKSERVPERISA
jgi:pilus assembly protein CpaE